jgi:methylthioribose-1-phosphate isomerase
MKGRHDQVRAIEWQDHRLRLLDQRILPAQITYLEYEDAPAIADAIRDMVVRGAPAIGITAAYGMVLSAIQHRNTLGWIDSMEEDMARLAESRPTAVNLFWALERIRPLLDQAHGDELIDLLEREAIAIHEEDIAANHYMGDLGAALMEGGDVLTHCNAGALATGGYGTALGVIRSAYAQGRIGHVYADETRPWLQGARLTAWEMVQDEIPVSILCEGAAASLMQSGKLGWVVVGSDRIAANGDVANKIGTYGLAIMARYHSVKFMVAAPIATIDMQAESGADIPIEERDISEVLGLAGRPHAAAGAGAINPAFDVTPASLVDAIVTEKGVVIQPDAQKIRALMRG